MSMSASFQLVIKLQEYQLKITGCEAYRYRIFVLSQSQSSAKAKPNQIIPLQSILNFSKAMIKNCYFSLKVPRTKDHIRKHFLRREKQCVRISPSGITIPGQRSGL